MAALTAPGRGVGWGRMDRGSVLLFPPVRMEETMEGHHERPKVSGGSSPKVVGLIAVAVLLLLIGGAIYSSQSGNSPKPAAPATEQAP